MTDEPLSESEELVANRVSLLKVSVRDFVRRCCPEADQEWVASAIDTLSLLRLDQLRGDLERLLEEWTRAREELRLHDWDEN